MRRKEEYIFGKFKETPAGVNGEQEENGRWSFGINRSAPVVSLFREFPLPDNSIQSIS